MHRHNNTSGACQENQGGPTSQVLEREISNNPFLTPPEAFVKAYLNSYQRYLIRSAEMKRFVGAPPNSFLAAVRP
jgi:hypothetical protein